MDRRHTDPVKERTTSSTSDNSITEYVNDAFEDSELQLSKVVSVNVEKDLTWVKNPISDLPESKSNKNLQNFVDTTESEKCIEEPIALLHIRKMYLAAFVVLLFAVCMGMTATYSATATVDMGKPHSTIKPDDEEISWIGSLMAIGALFGGFAASFLTNYLGRKGTLMFNTIPSVAGWCMIAYADTLGMIYAARIVTGFCTGVISVATPMYLVEISTPEVRGLLGSSFQLFVVTGVLFIAGLGSVLTWRHSAVASAITCLVAAALMVPMPESPKWLISKEKRNEAKKAIIFLQGKEFDTEGELYNMEEEIKSQPKSSVQLKELAYPEFYKPLIYSVLLMFFQQFSGVNAIMFYCAKIFENAKSSMDSIQATIVVAVVQVIATLAASLLMDKAGRKILLMTSSVFMAISLIIFGGFSFAKYEDETIVLKYGWVPLLCLMSFIAAFSLGFGPAPWLMVAEMTSARFRGVISGSATTLNWCFVFMVTKLYHAEEQLLHDFGVYFSYSVICVISIFFTYFWLPETKGKTLEEIQERFRKSSILSVQN
ncbi:facilitated trehalose transporter Tret1 [Parasteatoda tepidariorum]|nr:facilitated trehalose transporter Tret1 [Parasteatoda tepidariorum]